MAKPKGYTTLNLPTELIDELRIWRQAFIMSYGRTFSYAEMIRSMLDDLDTTEPDVTSMMDIMIDRHPEFAEKIGKYKGIQSEEEELSD